MRGFRTIHISHLGEVDGSPRRRQPEYGFEAKD